VGFSDPTIDILDDNRIITSNLVNISAGGVAIVVNNVRQPDKMKQLPPVVIQWHMPVLIPNEISMEKIQTLGDVRKLGGKILVPQYWGD
jgi:hypothetical protein